VRQPKKPRKDGGGTQHRIVEQIRVKQILGEVLELILNSDESQIKRIMNSASWQIKKAILVEALELGHIEKASNLATQILNLTEVKEKKLTGDIGLNVDNNIRVLMAEITDVPYEILAQRAEQLRELRRIGASADRGGDVSAESGELLLVEDEPVQRQAGTVRKRNAKS
jgi:hypothetical protein